MFFLSAVVLCCFVVCGAFCVCVGVLWCGVLWFVWLVCGGAVCVVLLCCVVAVVLCFCFVVLSRSVLFCLVLLVVML